MIAKRRRIAFVAGFLTLFLSGGWGEATSSAAVSPRRLECEGGHSPIGYLGITDLEGSLSFFIDSDTAVGFVRFYSEPEIVRVDPEGPGRGKVEAGDLIVAVNGKLITTEEGSRLFTNPPLGAEVYLGLRRGEREFAVPVAPEPICPDDARTLVSRIPAVPDRVPLPPWGLPGIPLPPLPAAPPFILDSFTPAHVLLGVGLRCSLDGTAEEGNLRFTEPPVVFRVGPGSPAEKAGLEKGDVITRAGGLPIETLEGTKRAVELKPGEDVVWTVRRGKESREIRMRGDHLLPEPKPLPEPDLPGFPAAPAVDHVRYVGTHGTSAIEVRSFLDVRVEVDEKTGEMFIRAGGTIVRLTPAERSGEE